MTIQIKTKSGEVKQYSTVAERLQALHEAGKVLEVLESAPVQVGDGWIWRVRLTVDGLTYVGNAEVHLNSTNFAEKADPWATAETSAVGRAIAWSGYAGTPDNPSIASADEVIRAQAKVVDAPAFTEAEQAQLATIKQGIRTDQWTAFKVHVWGKRVEDDELTSGMLPRLQSAFDKLQKGGANGK